MDCLLEASTESPDLDITIPCVIEDYQNDHKEKNMREDRIRKTRVRRQGTRDTKGE